MGVSLDVAPGSIRLTVGRDNTKDEIDETLATLKGAIQRLRDMSPLNEAVPVRAR